MLALLDEDDFVGLGHTSYSCRGRGTAGHTAYYHMFHIEIKFYRQRYGLSLTPANRTRQPHPPAQKKTESSKTRSFGGGR